MGYVSGPLPILPRASSVVPPLAAVPMDASSVLVVLAHPAWHRSRVHRRLAQAARALAPAHPVEVCDLHGLYPDYAIDARAEQERLLRADLIVWQHPIHWYGMPALMKLWVDDVLAHGWAYGHGGTALRGKSLWLVTSTGAPAQAWHPQGYNRRPFADFLPPYEQIAALCGLRFLPPWVLHGAAQIDDATLDHHAQDYAHRLASHPAWPDLGALAPIPPSDVPDADRPRERPRLVHEAAGPAPVHGAS